MGAGVACPLCECLLLESPRKGRWAPVCPVSLGFVQVVRVLHSEDIRCLFGAVPRACLHAAALSHGHHGCPAVSQSVVGPVREGRGEPPLGSCFLILFYFIYLFSATA